MLTSSPASSYPSAPIHWSEISFLEGKRHIRETTPSSPTQTQTRKLFFRTLTEVPPPGFLFATAVCVCSQSSVHMLKPKCSRDKTSGVNPASTTHAVGMKKPAARCVVKHTHTWNDWYGTNTSASHMLDHDVYWQPSVRLDSHCVCRLCCSSGEKLSCVLWFCTQVELGAAVVASVKGTLVNIASLVRAVHFIRGTH